ncbi:MAG: outer membrane protein transport protein [Labilithrix sp.]|nr:outer membrane protein transport protein [Labilithrix sp.]
MRTSFRRVSRGLTWAALATGALLFTSSDAQASGYLTARFGADHGTPAMPNTYAIYFNPAAIGGTSGTTITGDAAVLLRWARYTRDETALSPSQESLKDDETYVGSNTGRANLLNLLALPFLGVTTDFGGSKYFRAGYAAYVPFGGFATWDKRPIRYGVPGTEDGPQRWHNISGEILAIYNTLAFAVKPTPRLSIGANVSPVFHTVATVRARNPDGSDDTIVNGGLQEGRSLLTASGLNMSAALGVYYEASDEWRFGLSYTSQPGFGTTKMTGELSTQLGSANPGAPDKIDFYQTYPDIIRFGTAWRPSQRFEMRADFEFVRWSVFDRQCVTRKDLPCDVANDGLPLKDAAGNNGVILNVPRNWNNAIGARVGPAYWLTDQLELFGSLGITTPAVPHKTIDASTIDSQRLYYTVGLRAELNRHWALGGSLNYIQFFDVDTKGTNDQNISAHPSDRGGGEYNASRSPSADGVYRSHIGFVNLNVSYTF